MNMTLKPVVLITGASGGIGAELAKVFAAHGDDVLLVARRLDALDEVAASINANGRGRAQVQALDLLTPNAGDALEAALAERGLEPSVVVNNAAFGLMGDAADLDRARQVAMVDLNVRLLTDLSLRFLPSLKRHRGGVLNVASVAGFMPGPRLAIYHASKAYVVSFSEALYAELKPQGVRVTALCPGPVETPFLAAAGIPENHFPSILKRSAARVAQEGYAGFMRGKRLVVPGSANWLGTVLPRLFPRGLVLKVMGRF